MGEGVDAIHELASFTYGQYSLGSVAPLGWIRREIDQSGRGLGGHLFHFYRFVKDSTWLGGSHEYSALNEAAPYWYNYIVPLAYSVDETGLATQLKQQADHFLDYILKTQAEDGWLGPERTRETRGIWARCLLLQGMINHALVDSERYPIIVDSLLRFARLLYQMLSDNYTGYLPADQDTFDPQWFGVARAHEMSLNLQWLYELPEASGDKRVIWEVMEMLWEGSRKAGRDWTQFFDEATFPQTPSIRRVSPNFQHGVNVAQGLRYPAQLFRMHPSDELRIKCHDAVSMAFRYHGTPSGSLSSDEYVGGLSPQRGAELCCSVELMFSLAYLYRLFGDAKFADQVEMAAFNAFPAAISPDWWSHQYVTQINQPWARDLKPAGDEKLPFFDVCSYANVFGLEPEFPCCTVNHPTALPKLLMDAFVPIHASKTSSLDAGILHAYLFASKMVVPGTSIACETTYPFSPLTLKYTITADKEFAFYIRVPEWATGQSSIQVSTDDAGTLGRPSQFSPNLVGPELARLRLHKIQIPSCRSLRIEVSLQADIQVHTLADQTVCISRGPLLYAFEIPYSETTRMPRNYKDQRSDCSEVALQAADDEVDWKRHVRDHDYLPTAPWGVAVDVSASMKFVDAGFSRVRSDEQSMWSSSAKSEYIEAAMREVDWPVANGTAAHPKEVNVGTSEKGKSFVGRLIPYGCAKLHIAQFPVINGQ